jgi:hypothetical protein
LVAGDDVNALAAAIPRTVSLSRADVRKRAVLHCSSETMLTAYLRLYREMIASPVVSLHSRRPHRLIDVAGGRG